jgi:hypothetical protein
VSSAAITLCVASQRVVPKVSVYFVVDSVRKLLVTPSYSTWDIALVLANHTWIHRAPSSVIVSVRHTGHLKG